MPKRLSWDFLSSNENIEPIVTDAINYLLCRVEDQSENTDRFAKNKAKFWEGAAFHTRETGN